MDDLLQSQIRQSCKLAFPNGLKDLMSDISREVLRAQPKDLYKFIADYLSVMLVARENLNVASRVTDGVCTSECCPELEDELRQVGLSDEDIETTIEIIMKYFEEGGVKESTLLCKLMNKTELKETQLPKVLTAVRQAFLKHQYNKSTNIESETNSDMDETMAAAKHTLKLYRQAVELGENYNMAAEKIQAAYRAYNVRRELDPSAPKREKSHEKTVTPGAKAITFGRDGQKMEQQYSQNLVFDRCASKASSLSLAGSFITLPPYKPYSANDVSDIMERDEDGASENATIDYTAPGSKWNEEAGRSEEVTLEETQELPALVKAKHRSVSKYKSISFVTLPQIKSIEKEESFIEEVDFEENEKVLDVHEVETGKLSGQFDDDALEDVRTTNDDDSNKSNSTFSEDYSSESSKGSIYFNVQNK